MHAEFVHLLEAETRQTCLSRSSFSFSRLFCVLMSSENLDLWRVWVATKSFFSFRSLKWIKIKMILQAAFGQRLVLSNVGIGICLHYTREAKC